MKRKLILLGLVLILLVACSVNSVDDHYEEDNFENDFAKDDFDIVSEENKNIPDKIETEETPDKNNNYLNPEEEIREEKIIEKIKVEEVESKKNEFELVEKPKNETVEDTIEDKPQEGEEEKPQKEEVDVENYVTISIRVDTILDNWDKLDDALRDERFVPSNGIILKEVSFILEDGESVFDILLKASRKYRIHMEYQGSRNNQYGSVYVQGINNIYEYSCGDLSGWMFAVNGNYPNVASDKYILKPGDVIQWNYTCNLGRDLGARWTGNEN